MRKCIKEFHAEYLRQCVITKCESIGLNHKQKSDDRKGAINSERESNQKRKVEDSMRGNF